MKRVLAIILGGGKGSRLYPLTKMRAKPAVPLAGKYRLIDIPISNCINSGIEKMYVLTQFNSASLNRHIGRTYNLNGPFGQGFVEVLAAQQTPDSPKWFEGTADAVRKYQWLFQEWDVDEYLILSGDQLYRMDYSLFVKHHRDNGADLTVAALPVDEAQAILGLVRTECEKGSDLEDKIIHIERDLYVLMAELATDPSKHDKLKPGKSKVNEEMIKFLEDFIDEITASFELPKEFVLPGQNRISALLDVSRTVVRRAERRAITCNIEDSLAVAYLNRLSDLLWAMARWQEGESITSRSVK